MKINKNKLEFFFYSVLSVVIMTYISFDNYNFQELTFWIVGLQSSISLIYISTKQKVSLFHIFFFFSFLFFFIVPLMQYKYNKFLYIDNQDYSHLIIYTNLMIICWNFIYLIIYLITYKKRFHVLQLKSLAITRNLKLNILIVLSLIIIFVLYSKYGIDLFLYRQNIFLFLNTQVALIYTYFFKPMIFFTFLFFLFKLIDTKKTSVTTILTLIILTILTFIYNLPTSIARFYLFAIILSIYIPFFVKRNKNQGSFVFIIILFIGILFSMILGFIRKLSYDTGSQSSILIDPNYFFVGNFDAYENFLLSIYYVSVTDIKYGSNIISIFFFFIPRSIWTNKPVGTGTELAQYLDDNLFSLANYNIAQPLISEFYISFHFVGILISGILLGYITAKIDKSFKYYLNMPKNYTRNVLLALYGIFIGLFLFILRGDLLSAFAYTIGIMNAYYIVLKIFSLKLRKVFFNV